MALRALQSLQLPLVPSTLPAGGEETQCLHPKGSGSYTCLSFGAPHKPIFAFHTVQDQDGFFFGTGAGFPEDQQLLLEAERSAATAAAVRKIRKVLVPKTFIQKKLFREPSKEAVKSYDFNSQKTKRMVTFPTINGLPITAYQEKLLRQSESNTDKKSIQQVAQESETIQK